MTSRVPRRYGSVASWRHVRMACAAAIVAALGLGAAACTSAGQSGGGHAVAGGVVTFAEQPADPPNYIFPLFPLDHWDVPNADQMQPLLYRPLYFFGSASGTPAVNAQKSLADPPVYS